MKSAKKLRSTRGETMVEMLVSITLLVLAMSILGAMLAAAYHSDEAARAMDQKLEDELSLAERHSDSDPSNSLNGYAVITLNGGSSGSVEIPIKIHGADDALKSYDKDR